MFYKVGVRGADSPIRPTSANLLFHFMPGSPAICCAQNVFRPEGKVRKNDPYYAQRSYKQSPCRVSDSN